MKGLFSRRRDKGFSVYAVAEPNLVKIVRCMDSCMAERT